MFRIGSGKDLATAAVTGVNPAVGSEDKVIGHEVRVARGEAAIENHFLVSLAVTIGIAEPDDVRLADDDDAVLIMAKTRD